MKKGLTILLALMMLFSCACAEPGLTASFPPQSGEGGLTELLGERTGLPVVFTEGEPGGAENRMLEDPECVLCGSQSSLIAGLQGYTKEDLRQAMVPVFRMAVTPLYLVMDRDIAEGYGINDLETLQQYIEENEYDLTFARHLGADPEDRAMTQLSNEAAVLTDYFRGEKVAEALRDGEAAGAIFSGAELAENAADWLIICCMGAERSSEYPDVPCAAEAGWTPCEGEWYCLFMSAAAKEEDIGRMAEAAAGITAEELPAGYELRPLGGEELGEAVRELFRDYKQYMTEEGLFFYEE